MGSQVDPIRKPLNSNEEDQTMTMFVMFDAFTERAQDWWEWSNMIDSSNQWRRTKEMMEAMRRVARLDGDHSLSDDLEILALIASERVWWKLDEKLED